MRKQAVAAGDVNNPSAPKDSPCSAGHFPGFVELFPRQTSGFAQRPANTIEERRARKSPQIVVGQSGA